jgi:hypothetical protein
MSVRGIGFYGADQEGGAEHGPLLLCLSEAQVSCALLVVHIL